MEQKIDVFAFFKELVRADFGKLDTDELVQMYAKVLAVQKNFARVAEQDTTNVETTMLQGFNFYKKQMDAELKKRKCFVVDMDRLVKENQDMLEDILKTYPLEGLVKILSSAEALKSVATDILKEKTEKEILRRTRSSSGDNLKS